MLKIIKPFIIIVTLTACQTNDANINSSTNNVVAQGQDILITYTQLDNVIKQQLYDELSRIHLIRRVALGKIIQNKLLTLEASKYNVTNDEYLEKYIASKSSTDLLNKFIIKNNYGVNIPVYRRGLEMLSTQSMEGEMELDIRFKRYLKEYLYDSLKLSYNIISNLREPKSPSISLEDIDIQYRGNLKSATSVIIISDFECTKCQDNSDMYNELYEKYNNKVKFGFSHFSSRTTLSMMASESAAQQGKFWEMHDKIFDNDVLPDTLQFNKFAEELNLDMEKFQSSLTNYDQNNSIYKNIMRLSDKGLYGIPTILINNRVIFDSSSKKSIEALIEESLGTN